MLIDESREPKKAQFVQRAFWCNRRRKKHVKINAEKVFRIKRRLLPVIVHSVHWIDAHSRSCTAHEKQNHSTRMNRVCFCRQKTEEKTNNWMRNATCIYRFTIFFFSSSFSLNFSPEWRFSNRLCWISDYRKTNTWIITMSVCSDKQRQPQSHQRDEKLRWINRWMCTNDNVVFGTADNERIAIKETRMN